jgi:hypothetical protein
MDGPRLRVSCLVLGAETILVGFVLGLDREKSLGSSALVVVALERLLQPKRCLDLALSSPSEP